MRTIRIIVSVLTKHVSMYICICNAITDRDIAQAAECGARSSEDLARELGVGLGCGRCTSCAKSILVDTVSRLASRPSETAAA